jgi:hypothetical protein
VQLFTRQYRLRPSSGLIRRGSQTSSVSGIGIGKLQQLLSVQSISWPWLAYLYRSTANPSRRGLSCLTSASTPSLQFCRLYQEQYYLCPSHHASTNSSGYTLLGRRGASTISRCLITPVAAPRDRWCSFRICISRRSLIHWALSLPYWRWLCGLFHSSCFHIQRDRCLRTEQRSIGARCTTLHTEQRKVFGGLRACESRKRYT